jgi:PEP-CTERM motif
MKSSAGQSVFVGVSMRKFGFVCAASMMALLPAAANAAVLTFDDVTNFSAVGSGYNGLDFNNFHAIDSSVFPTSGYAAGVVSPSKVILNWFAQDAFISSATDFVLNSFYLTAAWNDGLQVKVDGFNNGSLVWSQTLSPSATAPTLYTFASTMVDQVKFSSFGGTLHPGYNGGGTHFALDNLTFNAAGNVPEPAAWAMMLAGFGLVGSAMRRREKVAVTFA